VYLYSSQNAFYKIIFIDIGGYNVHIEHGQTSLSVAEEQFKYLKNYSLH